MIEVKNNLAMIQSECSTAISKYKVGTNVDLLNSIKIDVGSYDFFDEAAVYDKDRNRIFIKENSFSTLQQLKHIITHEYYHIVSTDKEKDITGFMNIDDKEKLRGLNEGYTELLAMSTMPDDEHIVYIPQVIIAMVITKMLTKEKMDDYYFHNKPKEIYADLLEKLKNKEAVDNLLRCLTIELKPRQESILGTMEFCTMALFIENNDLDYEEYQDYRNILFNYNNILIHSTFQDQFSSCKDVVKNLDQIYTKKEKNRIVNDFINNKVQVEGTQKS